MAVTPIKSKGTLLTIGSQITGVLDIELPNPESETYEADYLDNTSAGIPYKSTGRAEGGSISGNAWFSAASYQALLTLISTPSDAGTNCTITLSNNTTISFVAAGIGIGGSVAGKDGVKCKFSAKLDGLPT